MYTCICTSLCLVIFSMFIVTVTGCQPESDEVLGIEWQLTPAGTVAEGQCPDDESRGIIQTQ